MKKTNLNFYLLSTFVFFIFLYQTQLIIFSDLAGDDMYDSQMRGAITSRNYANLIEQAFINAKYWYLVNGRLALGGWLMTATFYFFLNDPVYIKIAHWCIIFLSSLTYCFIIYYLTYSKKICLLMFSVFPIVFQFRDWHDPYLIFPIYSLGLLFFLISVLFFIYFLINKKKFNFFISIFLYAMCCFSREEFLVLSPIFFILEKFFFQKRINKSYYFLLLSLAIIFWLFYLKFTISSSYSGTTLSLRIESFKTIFFQVLSSIPLIFFLQKNVLSINEYDLIFFVIFTTFLFFFLKKNSLEIINKIKFKIFIFGSIFLAPALLIGISEKYINELNNKGLGYGHIPVIFQNFFMILLILLILKFLIKKNFYFISALILSTISLVNIGSNKYIVEENLPSKKIIRHTITKALKSDILKHVDEYSTFIWSEAFYDVWKRNELITMFTEKNFIVAGGYYNYEGIYNMKLQNNLIKENQVYGDIISEHAYSEFAFRKLELTKNENGRYYFKKFKRNLPIYKKENINSDFLNSDKYYVIFIMPNFIDNRVFLVKIESIEFDKNQQVEFIYTKEIISYSEKNKVERILLHKEINFTKFLHYYDMHNPDNEVNKNILLNEIKNFEISNKDNNIFNLQKKISLTNNTGYTGEIICRLTYPKISTSRNKSKYFWSAPKYNKIMIKITNNSNANWEINNLDKKDFYTLAALIQNQKKIILVSRILNKTISLKPGQSRIIELNYNDLLYLNDQINRIKRSSEYDNLILTFIHEGKKILDNEKDLVNCKIPLVHENITLKHKIETLKNFFYAKK